MSDNDPAGGMTRQQLDEFHRAADRREKRNVFTRFAARLRGTAIPAGAFLVLVIMGEILGQLGAHAWAVLALFASGFMLGLALDMARAYD